MKYKRLRDSSTHFKNNVNLEDDWKSKPFLWKVLISISLVSIMIERWLKKKAVFCTAKMLPILVLLFKCHFFEHFNMKAYSFYSLEFVIFRITLSLVLFCIASAGRIFGVGLLLLAVTVLNEDNFEELTQMNTGATTGRWFVKFYAPVFLVGLNIIILVVWTLQEACSSLGGISWECERWVEYCWSSSFLSLLCRWMLLRTSSSPLFTMWRASLPWFICMMYALLLLL